MQERKGVYFVSDVHLGLRTADPAEREARFLSFLKSIPRETTAALVLLGDIWDFWYEYRDVVPREGARVVAALVALMDAGVEVLFCEGNHDIWTFSYFESLGMKKFTQPQLLEFGGKVFCLGHGDALGGAGKDSAVLRAIFHSRIAQKCFATIHPWLAWRFATGWSGSSRQKHAPYRFEPANEPLFAFARQKATESKVDYFIFGHYHDAVDVPVPEGGRFVVLKDWIGGGWPHAFFDGEELTVTSSF